MFWIKLDEENSIDFESVTRVEDFPAEKGLALYFKDGTRLYVKKDQRDQVLAVIAEIGVVDLADAATHVTNSRHGSHGYRAIEPNKPYLGVYEP